MWQAAGVTNYGNGNGRKPVEAGRHKGWCRNAMRISGLFGAMLLLFSVAGPVLAANPTDERLERVVILTRHGVRSAMATPEELGRYTLRPWPHFSAPPGNLTARGATLLTMLGGWYRERYRADGLLSSSDCSIYLWANHTQRTVATAEALARGLAPGCELTVHQSQLDPDPLFDAPLTPLARPDTPRTLAAVSRRVGGNLAAWDARQRPDLERFEALLLQCARIPCSAEERSRVERRLDDTRIVVRLDEKGDMQLSSPALAVGGLAESLIMAYADGLDFPGWQGIDTRSIGQALAIHGAGIDLRTRTPEVGRQSSTYLAMRLLATLQRGTEIPAVADPVGGDEKIVVLSGHDGTLTMLAGLLGLNWHLPGYAAGEAAPGGALLFELWRRGSDGQRTVRIYYAAQTLDQMRFLVPLTLDRPPLSAALALPRCGDAKRGCPLASFTMHVLRQIEPPSPRRRPGGAGIEEAAPTAR